MPSLLITPVETGIIEFLDFEAQGIPHHIVLSGILPPISTGARFLADIPKSAKPSWQCFLPAPFT